MTAPPNEDAGPTSGGPVISRAAAGVAATSPDDGSEATRRAEQAPGGTTADGKAAGALLRFRVVAYVVGVGLIALVFIGVPLRYLADIPEVSQTISPVHGLMYMLYLVLTVDLAFKCRFSAKRTLGIMLAGTIPFLSFVAERRVTRLVRQAV